MKRRPLGTASKIKSYSTCKKKSNKTSSNVISNDLLYKCSYKIPLFTSNWRKIIQSDKMNEKPKYDVHTASNITRLEYDIHKRHQILKPIIKNGGSSIKLQLLKTGWYAEFDKLFIDCIYCNSLDRKYIIRNANKEVIYDKVLDAPYNKADLDNDTM